MPNGTRAARAETGSRSSVSPCEPQASPVGSELSDSLSNAVTTSSLEGTLFSSSTPSPSSSMVASPSSITNVPDSPAMTPEADMPEGFVSVPKRFWIFDKNSGTEGNKRFLCKLCQPKIKSISIGSTSRGNLRRHIESTHPHDLVDYDECAALTTMEKKGRRSTQSGGSRHGPAQVLLTDPRLKTNKGREHSLTSKDLEENILSQIILNCSPISTCESAGLRRCLLRTMSPKDAAELRFPNRQRMTALVESRFLKKKGQLIDMLKNVAVVAITVDAWSSNHKAYIGLTIHWLDPETLLRHSACLALKQLIGRHTHDVLAEKIFEVLDDFGIARKVCRSTTDNGRNFVKAHEVFGPPGSVAPSSGPQRPLSGRSGASNRRPVSGVSAVPPQPSVHATRVLAEKEDLFQVVDSDDEDDDMAEVDYVAIDNMLDRDVAGDGVIDDDPSNFSGMDIPAEDPSYKLPKHQRCATHTLNLVATTDASIAMSNPAFSAIYSEVISKLKALWSKQGRSVLASDKIRSKMKLLFVAEVSTRWNSSFNAFKRVNCMAMKDSEGLNELFRELDLPFKPFTQREFWFIEEYVRVMQPMAEAINILQGEGTGNGLHPNMGMGYLLPELRYLLDAYEDMLSPNAEKPNKFCRPLIRAIMNGVKERFQAYMNDDDLVVAAAVHPRYRLKWLDNNEEAEQVIELVQRRAIAFWRKKQAQHSATSSCVGRSNSSEPDQHLNSESVVNDEDQPAAKRARREPESVILQGARDRREKRITVGSSNAGDNDLVEMNMKREIREYLCSGLKDDVSLIPACLRDLYIETNTALPSSASVERLFSLVGRIFAPNRSTLTGNHLEMLVFLRANYYLLKVEDE